MITGFLFTEKCTAPSVNWRNLYVSRFSRLVPLYAVVILVLFTVVMALSDFELNVPRLEFVKELAQWLEHFQVRCIVVPGETLRLSRFLSRNALLVASLALLTAAIVTAQLRGGLHGSLLYVVHFLCG